MAKPSFSFSTDFKKQYHSREKPTRDEINVILKELDKMVKYITKNKLHFKKIKITTGINSTSEVLSVVVLSPSKIVVKRIERS